MSGLVPWLRGLAFGLGPFSHARTARALQCHAKSGTVEPSRNHPSQRGTSMPTCDCGARPEEIAAGIHYPGCTNGDGEPDAPSDHYGQ